MKSYLTFFVISLSIITFLGFSTLVQAGAGKGELLEYEVLSVNPQNWVVTAKETASGEVVKFRLPPKVFKGRTFDVFKGRNLDTTLDKTKIGNRFSISGPKNNRLDNLIMKTPLTKGLASVESRGESFEGLPQGPPLGWEILGVNSDTWVVTAGKRRTNRIVKFQVHPEAFKGIRFKANLLGIKQGKGFSIVTPNNLPFKDCCTLLESDK